MTAVPVLQELARLMPGGPETTLGRLLRLVCEQLAMDVAFVRAVEADGRSTVRAVERLDSAAEDAGLLAPQEDEWLQLVLAEGVLMIADISARPELAALESTAAQRIASYAGAALYDENGAPRGVLGVYGHRPHPSLNPRDRDVLTGLAQVIAPLVVGAAAAPGEPTVPLPAAAVAAAVEGTDVEELTRPLLEALTDITGLASTYLTVIHEAQGVQEIRYARNVHARLDIPEGLEVPWADTLCRRALEEDRPCTSDVPSVWGDSDAARSLGIQVYVSVPVQLPDGRLWGTLCAADSVGTEDVAVHLPTMRHFARLIGAQAEREEALRRARDEAYRDPLTSCASRRVVEPWLSREFAALSPAETLVVAYADVDWFKAINDAFGHAAGDAVLAEVGRRLRATARLHDLVARMGGDEFLVAARLPRGATVQVGRRVRAALSFSLPWDGEVLDVRASVGVAVSDGQDATAIVAMADAAMYQDKRAAAGHR